MISGTAVSAGGREGRRAPRRERLSGASRGPAGPIGGHVVGLRAGHGALRRHAASTQATRKPPSRRRRERMARLRLAPALLRAAGAALMLAGAVAFTAHPAAAAPITTADCLTATGSLGAIR